MSMPFYANLLYELLKLEATSWFLLLGFFLGCFADNLVGLAPGVFAARHFLDGLRHFLGGTPIAGAKLISSLIQLPHQNGRILTVARNRLRRTNRRRRWDN